MMLYKLVCCCTRISTDPYLDKVGPARATVQQPEITPIMTTGAGASKSQSLHTCGRPCPNEYEPYTLDQITRVSTTRRNNEDTMCYWSCTHGAPTHWSSGGSDSKDKDLARTARTCTTNNSILARNKSEEFLARWCDPVRVRTELDLLANKSRRRQTTPPQSGGNSSKPLDGAGGTTKTFAGSGTCENLGGKCRVPGAGSW